MLLAGTLALNFWTVRRSLNDQVASSQANMGRFGFSDGTPWNTRQQPLGGTAKYPPSERSSSSS
jgi:hypothetical protein